MLKEGYIYKITLVGGAFTTAPNGMYLDKIVNSRIDANGITDIVKIEIVKKEDFTC